MDFHQCFGKNCRRIKRRLEESIRQDDPDLIPDEVVSNIYWWRQAGGLMDPPIPLLSRVSSGSLGSRPRILTFALETFKFTPVEIIMAVDESSQGSEIEEQLFEYLRV